MITSATRPGAATLELLALDTADPVVRLDQHPLWQAVLDGSVQRAVAHLQGVPTISQLALGHLAVLPGSLQVVAQFLTAPGQIGQLAFAHHSFSPVDSSLSAPLTPS